MSNWLSKYQFNDAIKHYINEDMSDTDKILIRRQSKHLGKKSNGGINKKYQSQ